MEKVSNELVDLITWTQSPEPGTLEGVLSKLSDSDLVVGLSLLSAEPAQLCWAEFGRRRKYFDLQLVEVVAEGGKLNIDITGNAQPTHRGVGHGLKQ